jgi:hypothetical protein
MTDFPPRSWFGRKTIYELIQHHFPMGKSKIRIASGFFTIEGWRLVRDVARNKHVDLLVGINELTS